MCTWYVTWCSSCRRRWSWDSSCLLCSSKMCMRVSSRPLCCRSSLASAKRSASSGWAEGPSVSQGLPVGVPRCPCCSLSCSYSLCSVLKKNWEQISEETNVSIHMDECEIYVTHILWQLNSREIGQITGIRSSVWCFPCKYIMCLIFLKHSKSQFWTSTAGRHTKHHTRVYLFILCEILSKVDNQT